jgi:phosphohistidine phosphatase
VDIYLIRHAIAGHADETHWPDDEARPVTEKGARVFREAAAGLRRVVPQVEVVLSSAFVRAWQTAELLHDVAGWPEPVACAELEAGRPARAALAVLSERTEQSIALVGHEPHLSRLTSLLCTGDEHALRFRLKKGGVVCVTVDDGVAPAGASLRWALTPKLLRALGGDSI